MIRSTLLGAAVLGFAFASFGCSHVGSLKSKAAHDFNCSEDQIVVLNSGKMRDVEGCGKKGTYKWTGAHWLLQEPTPPPGVQTTGQPVVYTTAQPVAPQPVQPVGPGQPGVVYVTPGAATATAPAQSAKPVQPVPMGQAQPVQMGK